MDNKISLIVLSMMLLASGLYGLKPSWETYATRTYGERKLGIVETAPEKCKSRGNKIVVSIESKKQVYSISETDCLSNKYAEGAKNWFYNIPGHDKIVHEDTSAILGLGMMFLSLVAGVAVGFYALFYGKTRL